VIGFAPVAGPKKRLRLSGSRNPSSVTAPRASEVDERGDINRQVDGKKFFIKKEEKRIKKKTHTFNRIEAQKAKIR
jgi:hypothetical protein